MTRIRQLEATLIAATLAFAGAVVHAQALVQRPFPQNALRGEITFGTPPELTLNNRPMRMAPGARIRGQDNMLVMSAALVGQRAVVNYTIEPTTGLVKDVWILRPDEADRRKPWPRTAEEAQAWTFDPAAQTWTPRR